MSDCANNGVQFPTPVETWVDFTDADVFAPGSAERASIVAVKGQDDLAEICSEVSAQIIQAYSFASRPVGAVGQVPQGLKSRAIAIALWRFITEGVAKNESIQTKQRQDAFKEATDYLQDLASLKIGGATEPSISGKHHHFSKWKQDGI